MGNQVHIDKFGHDHYVDLLFFNRELQSLVVFELKKGEFKPAYLGQLAAYIRMLNDDERKPHENSTVGIVLCCDATRRMWSIFFKTTISQWEWLPIR